MGVVPGRASGSLRRVRGRASTWTASPESIHKDLEEKIAHIHQQKDAILYPSCFDANAGLFEALLTPEDTILSDELNHASIINGIHLCKTHKYRYLHLDMADLEARLQEAQKHRVCLVATDAAFSVDGDIAPLQEICCLASQYDALVFVDECHTTGFLGTTGPGTDELRDVMDQVTIISSTLGKVPGGASGIFVIGFSYPVVPKGKARIRVQLSAVHSEEDIYRCVEAFVEVGRLLRALP
uniref:Glycine C-acetyltransferase n=1 Tax=Rousettus aegyptiacus TaxID=9407 RepID=A0A7J8JDP3_ROUAE|nr:glycine C-acetyltransferase [Rousettus aegyptiacus]